MKAPRFAFALRTRGQAMVEYLVATALLLSLIAMPLYEGRSAASWMWQAAKESFSKLSAFLSLPG